MHLIGSDQLTYESHTYHDPEDNGLVCMLTGHPECLGVLLRRCYFDLIVTVTCRQMNALHWAAEGGNAVCISRLLQHGMDPNEATARGRNNIKNNI